MTQNPKPGDKIEIKTKDKTYTGILMERPNLADDKHLVIKLESGYNVGLKKDEIKETKIIKTSQVARSQSRSSADESSEMSHPKAGEEKNEKLEEDINTNTVIKDPKKPTVAIISTGGTISSKIDYRTGGVYAKFSVDDLVKNYPELTNFANIKAIDLMGVMSEDIHPNLWMKIAETVATELKSTEIKGAVIAHGTDTMAYTSAALGFILQGLGKPVAITGSQRSSDRGSADSFINLLCSVIWASSRYSGVALVMHGSKEDTFCFAHHSTKVRKMHTSARDAFQSINTKPLAKIYPDGKIEELNPGIMKRSDNNITLKKDFEEKVSLIKTYPGIDPEIVTFYTNKKFRGIVLEGTGLGHVPTIFEERSLLKNIERAIDSGISIAMTSQCIYGRVNPYVYSNLRKLSSLGVIYCEDMLPETAYVKLMWVLGQTKDPLKVKEMMLKNYSGEITECSKINDDNYTGTKD